jgi:steroid 5-alpha reductase family enzyme
MRETVFFYWFLIGWTVLAVIIFASLFFVSAPYGRHARRGWGQVIDPKWGWFVMEFPALSAPFFFFFFSQRSQNVVAVIFFVIWEIHYIQRTLIYPVMMKKSLHRMPLFVMFMGLFFNICNGYLNSRYLFTLSSPYPLRWLSDPRFILGVAMFSAGFVINIHSDSILRSLRRKGETGYKIPKGGAFKYISSPNYFGEILEWAGWGIATWSLPGAAFAFWTVANLVPRARANHSWYLSTFPDYPKTRKAIIPFVL